jgi:hypothetical protein
MSGDQTSEPPKAAVKTGVPKHFRRLKSSDLVRQGDFIVHERRGFELWEGPSGFRADAFVNAIYRRAIAMTIPIRRRKSG